MVAIFGSCFLLPLPSCWSIFLPRNYLVTVMYLVFKNDSEARHELCNYLGNSDFYVAL
jgi:hypothetical protein